MNSKIIATGAVVMVVVAVLVFVLNSNPGTNLQNLVTSPIAVGNTAVTPTPSSSSAVNELTIEVTASGYSPKSVTIKAGTKVIWENKSGETATVNSDPHPVHTDYLPLNLGQIEDGGSVSLIFDTPGTYGYHNHLNSSQKGTVVVE